MSEKKKEYKYPSEMPIYRKMTQVFVMISKIKMKMNKCFRYDIGQEMTKLCLEMFSVLKDMKIAPEDQYKNIRKFLCLYDSLQVLVKTGAQELSEYNIISEDDYILLIPELASIERQALGWMKSIKPTSIQDESPEFVSVPNEE